MVHLRRKQREDCRKCRTHGTVRRHGTGRDGSVGGDKVREHTREDEAGSRPEGYRPDDGSDPMHMLIGRERHDVEP